MSTLTELINEGYTASQLINAGFTLTELKNAGYTATELKNAGYTATELKNAGFTASQLKNAEFTLTELKNAEFTSTQLKTAGFTSTQLKTAGFTSTELRTAGFTASQLKNAGFTSTELRTTGFTASQLKTAKFTSTELRTAGFTSTELRTAGFTSTELRTAGFTSTELKNAGFTSTELRTAGFTSTELKNAEFTLTELKNAGFTSTELRTAGFTSTQLTNVGFIESQSQFVNQDIYLKGNKILLGVNSNGTVCSDESVPSNFNIRLIYNSAGFVYNPTGLSATNLNPDYTFPENSICNFAIGYNELNFYNSFSNKTYQITKILLINESFGDILQCTYNGTYNNIFNIQLIYNFDVNSEYFKITGKIKNISTQTLNNIKFLYNYDPNNSVDIGGSFDTNNKIIYQTNTDNKSCVFAESTPDSSIPGIYMYTDDLSANVYYGGSNNLDTNDNLFDTILPKGSSNIADIANSILFKKQSLDINEEYNFNFYIGFTIESFIYSNISIITINKTPIITTVPIATPIIYGQQLSRSSLTGGVATNNNNIIISGIFSFTTPSIVPKVGDLVSVTFSPLDTTNYTITIFNIDLIVVIPGGISSLSLPTSISLSSTKNLNIYNLNNSITYNSYNFYSSNNNVVTIDSFGNIVVKKAGKFYIIVTDMSGTIIYTTPYFIEIKG
jgi:uncharacterized protein YjbI with pentapeptide repeats